MANTIYKWIKVGTINPKERLQIQGFKHSEYKWKFLGTEDNALSWRDTNGKTGLDNLRPGTYAKAGGKLHNVKNLDPYLLAHI